MKPRSRIFFAAAVIFLALIIAFAATGCAGVSAENPRAVINRVLDATLPPDFTGPAHVEHKNPSVDITIDATELRRTAGGWEWKSLTYRRNGRVSHGYITLGDTLAK